MLVIIKHNRKAYMGSPITLSHLILSDIESLISWSLRFQKPISRKGAELSHMLRLNINRKAYKESPIILHLTIVTLKVTQISKASISLSS